MTKFTACVATRWKQKMVQYSHQIRVFYGLHLFIVRGSSSRYFYQVHVNWARCTLKLNQFWIDRFQGFWEKPQIPRFSRLIQRIRIIFRIWVGIVGQKSLSANYSSNNRIWTDFEMSVDCVIYEPLGDRKEKWTALNEAVMRRNHHNQVALLHRIYSAVFGLFTTPESHGVDKCAVSSHSRIKHLWKLQSFVSPVYSKEIINIQ